MTPRLRPMRWWDFERVVALEEELFEDAWSVEMFWSELAQAETRTYVVLEDDTGIVGYAGLAELPDASFVQTIGVTTSRQGEGLGRRLLVALLRDAHRRGSDEVALEVRIDNLGAQRLYGSYGFTALGVRRGYYQPSGTDALVMSVRGVATAEYAARLAVEPEEAVR
jgi:ribosomal-protein-alanine N-acetyltransferase